MIALCLLVILGGPVTAMMAGSDDPQPTVSLVESSLETEARQIRQFAFDGDLNTYFASTRNPVATDHFTLTLEKPVAFRSIVVTTGRPTGMDLLENGTIEVSSKDGKTFEEVAKFDKGIARVEAKDRVISAIRIKPGADLTHPLVIREIALDSVELITPFQYPVEFKVDVSDAPEMKEWAEKAAKLCEQWYPRINKELQIDGSQPATQITITLKSRYNGVAEASGTRITGSVKFFKDHPDDLGAMIHETCHIVQRYRSRNNPGWLVEGVADYVRFFVYEPGKAGPVNAKRAHYNDSYRTTASFLAYVSEHHDKDLVLKLNRLMRAGKYKDEVFKELTGKTVEELGEAWLASLPK